MTDVRNFAKEAIKVLARKAFLLKPVLVSLSLREVADLGISNLLEPSLGPLTELLDTLYDRVSADEGFILSTSWRQLPLVPQLLAEDLCDMQDLPEVSWDYKSVEDYMSTYFRLLRADCFGALQKGVMDFIRGTLDKRDLRVLRAEAVEFSVVRGIKGLTAYLECENIFDFAVPFPPRVLMQSNLVCLSIGLKPFSEVLWARVAERPTDPKAQKQAKIRVGLEFLDYQNHGFPLQSIMTRLMSPSSLLLADSPVFFLSFGPVLKRLQSMSDGQDSLPQGTLLLGRRRDAAAARQELPIFADFHPAEGAQFRSVTGIRLASHLFVEDFLHTRAGHGQKFHRC